MPKWVGKWAGGRHYLDGKRVVYVLEKMRGGVRYNITLSAKNEPEADKLLEKFDRDPEGFSDQVEATRTPTNGGLYVTTDSIQEVINHQKEENQSKDHIYATGLYLVKWGDKFPGREISTWTIPEIEAELKAWKTARKLRITALKTFCTYYADGKRGRLDPTKNPAAKLEIPKSLAAKHTKSRHYSIDEVQRAYAASDSQVQRDIIRVAIHTGAHTTEIERFAEGRGWTTDVDEEIGMGKIAGVIWYHHKNQELHPNSIDALTLKAAKRIRERGSIPNKVKRYEFCVRVQEKLKSERAVLYGALRHSFITWARSKGGKLIRPKDFGLSLEEIRDAVNHKNIKTTAGYDGTEVPPMIVVPSFKLVHPDDPTD